MFGCQQSSNNPNVSSVNLTIILQLFSHKILLSEFALYLKTYRSNMTSAKQNPTQQQQQPLSLSQVLWSFPTPVDSGVRVRSMPKARRQDPKEQQDFMRSILEEAIEIANDVDSCFPEDSSSKKTYAGKQEENSRSQIQRQ
jgi:hypothetical protein